ncbi:MAG: endonuclease domain-containing protein [Phycisphaerales bacterium]
MSKRPGPRQRSVSAPVTDGRARTLRKAMSQAEVYPWLRLRRRGTGFQFNRQRPIGPYVADFFCHEAKLVVEVDGAHHGRAEQRHHDARRDAFLRSLGLFVFRAWATDVVQDTDGIATAIARLCRERTGAHDRPLWDRRERGKVSTTSADHPPPLPSGGGG